MRVRLAPFLALLVAVAFLPSSAAQHAHGAASGVVISHDVPSDGRTYVGDVSHFGVLDLGSDLVPDFHQQNHIRVTENGAVLFETTADTGHDYDGVNTFDVAFPVEGTYTVEALDDQGMPEASFSGVVQPADPTHNVTLALQVPATAAALQQVPIHMAVTDAAGLVDHSDVLLEVLQGSQLVLRTHVHTHTTPEDVTYAFAQPGTYTVRALAYLSFPSTKAHPFPPQLATRTITVGAPTDPAAILALASLPTPTATSPVPDNVALQESGTGGNYTLVGTYDPYTAVGPFTQQHLDALVMDPATHAPVQHVDFKARLVGPLGTVFDSASLHEYDGIYEFTTTQPIPGQYTLRLEATYGTWHANLAMPYTVLPPVEPAVLDTPPAPAAGPELVTVEGLDSVTAGHAQNVTFRLADLAGNAFPHSEMDVAVLDAQGVPVTQAKLHTHDGSFPVTLAFPAAGAYTVRVAPFPLDAEPVTFGTSATATDLSFPVTVAPGPGIPATAAQITGPAPAAMPGAPVVLLALALVAGAWALARRA